MTTAAQPAAVSCCRWRRTSLTPPASVSSPRRVWSRSPCRPLSPAARPTTNGSGCARPSDSLHLLGSADEPGGAARWWLPVLGRFGWSEPFYRNFVATEHAAEAVAVTARAADDIRLRGLLKQCLAVAGCARSPGCTSIAGGAPLTRSMPAPLRLAVIGAAHSHVRYALDEVPLRADLALVAVADPDPATAGRYAGEFGRTGVRRPPAAARRAATRRRHDRRHLRGPGRGDRRLAPRRRPRARRQTALYDARRARRDRGRPAGDRAASSPCCWRSGTIPRPSPLARCWPTVRWASWCRSRRPGRTSSTGPPGRTGSSPGRGTAGSSAISPSTTSTSSCCCPVRPKGRSRGWRTAARVRAVRLPAAQGRPGRRDDRGQLADARGLAVPR